MSAMLLRRVLYFVLLVVGLFVVCCISYGRLQLHSWHDACRHYRNARAAGKLSAIAATCTTMPSNMYKLKRALAAAMLMSPAPHDIYVNIPDICCRTGEPYQIPQWLRDAPVTLLPGVVDTWPSTKYLPTLQHLVAVGDNDRSVLVFDDDAILDRRLLAFLEKAVDKYPDSALTFGGKRIISSTFDFATGMESVYGQRTWRCLLQKHGIRQSRKFTSTDCPALDVDIIMGHSTYVIRPRFFDIQRLADYDRLPREARFVDDIVISGCLAERGIRRLVIHQWPEPRKDVTAVFADLYDELMTSSAMSVATMGNRRRHAPPSSASLHNSVNRTHHNDNVTMQHFADAWQ